MPVYIMTNHYRKQVFQDRLVQLMQEQNLNQGTLAEKAYTSRKTINEYVGGKKDPVKNGKTDNVIPYVADALGVRLEYLLGMTDFRTKADEEYYRLDKELEMVSDWVFENELLKKIQQRHPELNFDTYTKKEKHDLISRIESQIDIVAISFDNEHKRKERNHD